MSLLFLKKSNYESYVWVFRNIAPKKRYPEVTNSIRNAETLFKSYYGDRIDFFCQDLQYWIWIFDWFNLIFEFLAFTTVILWLFTNCWIQYYVHFISKSVNYLMMCWCNDSFMKSDGMDLGKWSWLCMNDTLLLRSGYEFVMGGRTFYSSVKIDRMHFTNFTWIKNSLEVFRYWQETGMPT